MANRSLSPGLVANIPISPGLGLVLMARAVILSVSNRSGNRESFTMVRCEPLPCTLFWTTGFDSSRLQWLDIRGHYPQLVLKMSTTKRNCTRCELRTSEETFQYLYGSHIMLFLKKGLCSCALIAYKPMIAYLYL